MPFINTKYSAEITPAQEQQLKTALGSAIALLGKSESWLMLGFEQNCSLYFRGENDGKICYIEVSLYGSASPAACDGFTSELCTLYNTVLGVPKDRIYIKYSPTNTWGWNGGNF